MIEVLEGPRRFESQQPINVRGRRRPGTRLPWWKAHCGSCGGPLAWGWCYGCAPFLDAPTLPLPVIERRLPDRHYTGRLMHSHHVNYHRDTASASKAWRARNPEKVKAYLAVRKRPTDRKAEAARYREKHREAINARKRQARARAKTETSGAVQLGGLGLHDGRTCFGYALKG